MDEKTNRRVMQAIFNLKNNKSLGHPVDKLSEEIKDLNKEIIIASLDHLEKLGHLEVSKDDNISYLLIKDSAAGYILELQEKEDQKWEGKKWNLVQVGLGFVLGIAGTIIGQILLKKILR